MWLVLICAYNKLPANRDPFVFITDVLESVGYEKQSNNGRLTISHKLPIKWLLYQ